MIFYLTSLAEPYEWFIFLLSTEDLYTPDVPAAKTCGKRKRSSKDEGDDKKKSGKKSDKSSVDQEYFRVTCKDNGGGMPHAQIPQMLGVVLSSTKYGVKQTRGKFGLGAKMALVWSKKSTGLPIDIKSSQDGVKLTQCRLDIDIVKNEPRILLHERVKSPDGQRGTEISVVIGGNWTYYKAKVCVLFVLKFNMFNR